MKTILIGLLLVSTSVFAYDYDGEWQQRQWQQQNNQTLQRAYQERQQRNFLDQQYRNQQRLQDEQQQFMRQQPQIQHYPLAPAIRLRPHGRNPALESFKSMEKHGADVEQTRALTRQIKLQNQQMQLQNQQMQEQIRQQSNIKQQGATQSN